MILVTAAFVFVRHSVIRHNHQPSSGIAGNDRQGHSFIRQQGWWWPLERRAGKRTQGHVTTATVGIRQSVRTAVLVAIKSATCRGTACGRFARWPTALYSALRSSSEAGLPGFRR